MCSLQSSVVLACQCCPWQLPIRRSLPRVWKMMKLPERFNLLEILCTDWKFQALAAPLPGIRLLCTPASCVGLHKQALGSVPVLGAFNHNGKLLFCLSFVQPCRLIRRCRSPWVRVTAWCS